MYTVYAISSLKTNYVYIGHTNNLKRRLAEHNSGNTPSNKSYRPFRLVMSEEFRSRSEAIEKEKELKKSHNRDRLRSLAKD